MQKISPEVDRAVRLELLRARAAVERESLAHSLADVTVSMSPSHLVKGLLPGLAGGGNSSKLAWQAFSMLRRHPMVLSSISAILLGGNKRSRLLKLGTGAVVAWQVYRAWRTRQEAEASSGVPTRQGF